MTRMDWNYLRVPDVGVEASMLLLPAPSTLYPKQRDIAARHVLRFSIKSTRPPVAPEWYL